MIFKDLVDLLNSGEAVAVVGSGISADAGLPSWSGLFVEIADTVDREGHDTARARAAAGEHRFPEAFDLLAKQTSRTDIHQLTTQLVNRVSTPGRHHARLADWPFRVYVTTNYDHLIESASGGDLVSVGNLTAELHKVTAGARDVVWHLHGGSRLSNAESRLLVTKSDYDEFYAESHLIQKLKALATAHRCVFVGFGFNDRDLAEVLRSVGRHAHRGRPSFAFIGYPGPSSGTHDHQRRLREDYNVEAIPYTVWGDNHSDLHRVLQAYEAFVLRRSISFGRTSRFPPGYGVQASSLQVQGRLAIAEAGAANPGLKQTLLGARVIAYIREHPGKPEEALEPLYRSGEPTKKDVLGCLNALRRRGTVTNTSLLSLSPEHQAKVRDVVAELQLSEQRFRGSITKRAAEALPAADDRMRERAVTAVARFLDALCRERGLGVAQNLATYNEQQTSRRTVALIQELPNYLGSCAARDEALAAVDIAAGILTRPSGAESEYLGRLCQAYFGQHLAGASETLATVDLDLIRGTCYLLDASVLVCLLAEGATTYDFTAALLRDLQAAGAVLATTDLFAHEIAEHAGWASRLVEQHGEDSAEIIDALRCKGDYRPNQFLRGYFLGSPPEPTFPGYLRRVLGVVKRGHITDGVIAHRLHELGVQTLRFDAWDGFSQQHFAKREEARQEIEHRRLELGTYKHERQTQAEAEVAIVVDGVRRGALRPPGKSATDAFFLSATRVVDQLPGLDRRICLLPEGLAQWLWSSTTSSPRHAELVFENLLWELAQGGIEFVNHTTLLNRFSGVVEVAESDLNAAVRDRREYLVDKYGPDVDQAFTDADPLDFPRLAREVQTQALEQMERRVRAAQESERRARDLAKISERDRADLERLRQRQKERHRQAESKKRAAACRTGKKGGRRGKKR